MTNDVTFWDWRTFVVTRNDHSTSWIIEQVSCHVRALSLQAPSSLLPSVSHSIPQNYETNQSGKIPCELELLTYANYWYVKIIHTQNYYCDIAMHALVIRHYNYWMLRYKYKHVRRVL